MVRNMMSAGLIGLGVLVGADAAMATTINTTSNVVFIVDESGSMSGEQAFLRNVVIDKLDADLAAAGVTSRSYGVIGYGGPNSGVPRLRDDAILDDAATTKTNLGTLVTSGGTEDGYQAIQFALDNLQFTAGAAINFILVTDEDRDVESSDTFASIKAALTSRNILLNAIINNPFTSDNKVASEVLGIDSDGRAFFDAGAGTFGTDTGAVIGNGSGTTETDYAELALQTGGAAWNLNLLRAGGDKAIAFANAFIDIKVQEITTQPPSPGVIPLPAGGWLLLTGLGGIAALRRRKKAA